MLIEQDPFMLEEQRYLNRLQRAHNLQEQKYKKHYENIHAPELSKKKQQEQLEDMKIEHRLKSLAEAQDRQR
jgi:predicted Rossmann fold nucleotide-binding protein DprA/Smf involved in DNA uptake